MDFSRVRWGRVLMGVMYIAAGTMHFVATRSYERIMPAYLPVHHELVLLSGAAEICGGLGMLIPGRRRPVAWGIVCLLIAVFPANLWMAQHPELFPGVPQRALWLRLPLQIPLIWWAYTYTKLED